MTLTFRDRGEAAGWCDGWLDDALALWADVCVDPATGAFREALTPQGAPVDAPLRARVQARQAFVFAEAMLAGRGAAYLEIGRRGFESFVAGFRQADGRFAFSQQDARTFLYEQDFALLAMSAFAAAGAGGRDWVGEARALRGRLEAYRHPAGGFRELGEHPFQANAHMHLLESALAWEEAGEADWSPLSDEIATLALDRFVDPEGGFLREFFDAAWAPAPGDDGRWVEPGHQFEWAWLLERWGRARGHANARAAARALFQSGLKGVDRGRGVAVNVLWDDLTVRDASARLWPQTEYLKAALILGEEAEALVAANAIAKYLDVPVRGVWRDKLRPDGTFVEEPAPASSFYHLWVALSELAAYVAARA
jgi:mannose-6-phosphate isomerase